jgi:hypothetical protein
MSFFGKYRKFFGKYRKDRQVSERNVDCSVPRKPKARSHDVDRAIEYAFVVLLVN